MFEIKEKELFCVDEKQWIFDRKFVGNHQILIIDNFYKNPQKILEVVSKLPYSLSNTNYFPGYRINLKLDLFFLYYIFNNLLRKNFYFVNNLPNNYFVPSFKNLDFIVNVLFTDKELPTRSPHIDSTLPYKFAISIYLNTIENGGTGFFSYENKIEGSSFNIEELSKIYNNKPTSYINSSIDNWKLIETVNSKFNRCVIYEQDLFHSAVFDNFKDFISNPRINQMIFI